MSDLYNRIDNLCKERKVSITTMCKESGASRASLSDLKVGRKQSLSADTLSKLAQYFAVSVDYLLTGKTAYPAARTPEPADGTDIKKAPAEDGKRSASEELKFALWGSCEDISDEDLADVLRYAAFVRERKKDPL